MGKLKFTAKDFLPAVGAFVAPSPTMSMIAASCATHANKRLGEMLAECPVVYGHRLSSSDEWLWVHDNSNGDDTHRARLVNVERIDE